MKKVSIQGVAGAFHEEAARKYFDQPISIDPQMTFEGLVGQVEKGTVDYGIIAIENTISGTINPNFRLLSDHKVEICGEIKLRIIQNLGVQSGTSISELKEVRSHYMALNQCRKFLSQHDHIKLVEAEDTALSAKQVSENSLIHTGAIGSMAAMKLYGLEVIAQSIETDKLNFTRFFIIKQKSAALPVLGDKITMELILNHNAGSLSVVLQKLERLGINLTKIESSAIVGQPWKYSFFIDGEFDNPLDHKKLNSILEECTHSSKILGIYKKDRHDNIS